MDQEESPPCYVVNAPIQESWGNQPLPPFPLVVDPEQIKRLGFYARATIQDLADPRLHCALYLRKGWVRLESRDIKDQAGFQLIARLGFRAGNEMVHLTIQSATLSRDIAPSDWLDLYLEGQKIERITQRHWITAAGTCQDLIAFVPTLGHPWVSRMTAIKDGDRIYFLRAWCSRTVYEAFADEFCIALNGFTLLQPTGETCAEALTEHVSSVGSLEAETQLRFHHPSNLKSTPVPEKGDAVGWKLTLSDPQLDIRMAAGLLARSPDDVHAMLLPRITALWQEPDLSLPLHPDVKGPFNEVPGELTGFYYEFPCAWAPGKCPSPSNATQPPGDAGPALQELEPSTSKLRLIVIVSLTAFAWLAYRPPPPMASRATHAMGRRAFELLLLYLRIGHPSTLDGAGADG